VTKGPESYSAWVYRVDDPSEARNNSSVATAEVIAHALSVDRRGALLVGNLPGDHPDEVLCSNWERSSLEDHGQLGGDLP
jgi:hypothetical protein